MKKKLASIILSIAVLFSFMPFFTIQAEAFSTGSKTLVKTRTVTIKPGKTYKSPTFKFSKKMTIQVPIKVKLSGKIKDSDYNFELKYTMSLKSSKGKTQATYKCPATGMYDFYSDSLIYEDWICYHKNSIAKPCFAKGKYYLTIKNTTKRTIKVTYSIKGYTKYATTAELKEELEADYDQIYVNAGKIGTGIPLVKSVVSDNPDLDVYFGVSHNGTLYLYPDKNVATECEATVTVTLQNKNKKYKLKLKVLAEPLEEEEEDTE